MTDSQTEARAIARYEFACPDCDPYVVEVNHGQYVRYADYTTALAAKDEELTGALEASERFSAAWRDAERRASRAEAQLAAYRQSSVHPDDYERIKAQLAEARKALGMMLKEHDILSGNFGDVMDPKHKRPDRWPTAAEAARRVLEGGKNG